MKELSRRFLGYALLVFFIGMGFSMIRWSVVELQLLRASQDWPQTHGEILNAGVSGGGYKQAYCACVQYRYVVAGQAYEGKRIRFGNSTEGSRMVAEDVVSSFSPGLKVPVFFDPQSPEESVLDRRSVNWETYGTLIAGFFFPILSVGLFVFWRKRGEL